MWCGGLTELLKITAQCNAYDVPVVCHASGPYSYHFAFSQNNTPFHEYLANSPDGHSVQPVFGDLFSNEYIPKEGYIDIGQLDAPGFGLKVNPATQLIPAETFLKPNPQKALRWRDIKNQQTKARL
jgi:L-rhamnonate dehydratase